MTRLQWYPGGAAWQLESSRRQMRGRAMRALQALLVDAAEQGLISRQEAVSMIPPLFLKVCTNLESLLRTAAGGRHRARPLP